MNYKDTKVLLLEGYARQSIPFLKAFRKLGCNVSVLCNSKRDVAYWSRYPSKKIVGVCDPTKYQESSSYICDLIKTGDFDLVVPLVDFSAKILSENMASLSKYSKLATNDFCVFEKASDKLIIMRICQENGIPCPKTFFDITSSEQLKLSNVSFPIVVKPRKGYGARGFHVFNSFEEIDSFFKSNNQIAEYVIQECIPQTNSNISVCLFIDNNGEVKASYTYCSRRWFPLTGGTGTLNELIDKPSAVDICSKLAKLLNLRGLVGFDLIEDKRDGISKIIEVNPRSLACSYIGFLGGINQARLILENELTGAVEPQEVNKKKIGHFVRMSQIDFLWFLKSPNRWKAKPSWFKISKTHDQLFSWADPFPWFAFLLQGLKNYKNDDRRKS